MPLEQFVIREARLADEHAYDEWESLWADDGIYWIPLREHADPEREISLVHDDRATLALRVKRLKGGDAISQDPRPKLRRVIGNFEIDQLGEDLAEVRSNFVLVESRLGIQTMWAGMTLHRLRQVGTDHRIVLKRVMLVNAEDELPTLGFLI
jgi:benzoate/toluate 1,2-dioxygenase subunit beta